MKGREMGIEEGVLELATGFPLAANSKNRDGFPIYSNRACFDGQGEPDLPPNKSSDCVGNFRTLCLTSSKAPSLRMHLANSRRTSALHF